MKKKLLILALHLAANGTDAYFTHRNMQCQKGWVCQEYNPLARPFVSHGNGLLITGFALETGLEIAVPLELRHKNHPVIADTLDGVAIGGHVTGAVISAKDAAQSK